MQNLSEVNLLIAGSATAEAAKGTITTRTGSRARGRPGQGNPIGVRGNLKGTIRDVTNMQKNYFGKRDGSQVFHVFKTNGENLPKQVVLQKLEEVLNYFSSSFSFTTDLEKPFAGLPAWSVPLYPDAGPRSLAKQFLEPGEELEPFKHQFLLTHESGKHQEFNAVASAMPVIFYAGHGEEDTGDWCFDDSDGEWIDTISFEEVLGLWETRKDKNDGQILVLIIDACHSGAWVDRAEALKVKNVVVYSSCRSTEVAMETPQGGSFTREFVNLFLAGEARDGGLFPLSLAGSKVGDQHPQLWCGSTATGKEHKRLGI